MFSVKNILWIKNFDFEDGRGEPKDKLLIVLHQVDSNAIIAPLTTSVDKVPDHLKVKNCIIEKDSNIHCYYIPKKKQVGEKGFAFDIDTFIHIQSNNIKCRNIDDLAAKYGAKNMIFVKDKLIDEEYCNLLYCLYNSKHVPRGIKPILEGIISEIETRKYEIEE